MIVVTVRVRIFRSPFVLFVTHAEMKVTNVGKVNILKSNCYSLQEGEPSVFERECAAGSRSHFQEKKRKRNDFVNQDQCQICWDVGELLCCDFCPTSFHLKVGRPKLVVCCIVFRLYL